MRHAIVVAVALALTFSVAWAHARQEPSKTVWEGVYTSAQAKKGKGEYADACGGCHGDKLEGTGSAPALAGDAFLTNWDGKSVQDVYERIATTMPQGAAGSLSSDVCTAIVTFLLESNGFPAGDQELPTASGGRSALRIVKAKPARQ